MERKRWIDVAKGIGIILVIIGHSDRPDLLLKLIQSFHMPLFFLLSGYVFSLKYSFPVFLKRKTKGLLKPYAIYAVLNFAVWMTFLAVRKGVDLSLAKTAARYIIGLVYSRGTWYWMPNCSPLWFLTAMFTASVMFYLILRQKKSVLQYLIVAAAFAFAVVSSYFGFVKLPWNIDSAMWGLLYMLIGYRLSQYEFEKSLFSHKVIWSFSAVGLLVAGLFAAVKNNVEFVSMDSMIMGNIAYMLLSTIGISLAVVIISALFIKKNCMLEVYGRNTLIILGMNYIVNKTVYLIWARLPERMQFDKAWIVQCALQVILLGLLAFASDIFKKKRKASKSIKKANV